MKVLQVNSGDIVGSRFNGYAARSSFRAEDIDSSYLVWKPLSGDPAVGKIFNFPGLRMITHGLAKIESRMSVHSVLQLQSFALPLHKPFRDAEVVHYHIVHDGYFSILAMPWLSWLKPTVWTWHDPWIMTGHCVYPLDCGRWQSGCGFCPSLQLPFAYKQDRTAFGFRQKKWVSARSDLDVVVASRHMLEMAQRSPIGQSFRLHHIPFGIDLSQFRPRDPGPARNRFGVLENRVVLFARAFSSPFKGFDYLVETLDRLPADLSLCIITTHERGLLNRFIGKFQIIDLGWVNDDELILDAYSAADFFVMPSTAEAFGMMAIEAMACGKPTIVFDGTSLPEVTFAPSAGIAVPMRQVDTLAAAIERLVRSPKERADRGALSRRLAEKHYDVRLHARRLADLYRSVAARQYRNSRGRAA